MSLINVWSFYCSLEFVSQSLANEEKEVEEKCYLFYNLHDIIMDYLKNNITQEEQKRYHLQLVQKYSDKCGGTFSELEEDGYIHQQLLVHVHAAGNMELLGQLLSNLLWVAACCKHWYASSLLDCYSSKHYQPFILKEVHVRTMQCCNFVRVTVFKLILSNTSPSSSFPLTSSSPQ